MSKKVSIAIALLGIMFVSLSIVSVQAVNYTWYVKAGDKFAWDVEFKNSTKTEKGGLEITIDKISSAGVITATFKPSGFLLNDSDDEEEHFRFCFFLFCL